MHSGLLAQSVPLHQDVLQPEDLRQWTGNSGLWTWLRGTFDWLQQHRDNNIRASFCIVNLMFQ